MILLLKKLSSNNTCGHTQGHAMGSLIFRGKGPDLPSEGHPPRGRPMQNSCRNKRNFFYFYFSINIKFGSFILPFEMNVELLLQLLFERGEFSAFSVSPIYTNICLWFIFYLLLKPTSGMDQMVAGERRMVRGESMRSDLAKSNVIDRTTEQRVKNHRIKATEGWWSTSSTSSRQLMSDG